jgi:cob(I)alamin adenosyltransferase
MRIYTKTGDKGTTGLVGGSRVSKTDSRIQALGLIDELNASVGVARTAGAHADLQIPLERVQNTLFDLGAEVATPTDSDYYMASVNAHDIELLENEIDGWTNQLEPLKNFILPGGSPSASQLHLARTICRRVEREMLASQADLEWRAELLTFLNRLSDWLFVIARFQNHLAGVEDVKWSKRPTN